MTATERPAMPTRSGGRPKRNIDSAKTDNVRVFADLKEMIYWLGEIQQKPQAQILDPLLRDQVETLYAKIEDRVEKIKRQRAAEEREKQEARKEFEG